MIRKFISYYKPHRRLFCIDMICAFCVALCDMIYPFIAKNIINDYVPDKNLRMIITWAMVLLGIYIIKALLSFVIEYWGHIVGVRMQGDMRLQMYKKLQSLPFSYYDENKTGAIMSRMINDLLDISELAHHGPEDLFLSAVMLTGSFVMLSMINIYLALIVFSIIPIIVFFAVKMRKNMMTAFKRSREEIASVNSAIETGISGIRVSRAYNAAEFETQKFSTSNEDFKNSRLIAYKFMGIFHSCNGFFIDFLYFSVLICGGIFYYYELIDIGEFTAFILYILMFMKPVNRLITLFESFQNGITGFIRFNEILEEKSEFEPENPVKIDKLSGDIVFDDVVFAYDGNDELILNNLNLKINKGKTIALVGPSGGGKTTLCHLIPRFYEVQNGKILIDGIDIKNISGSDLRRNIGIVAQDIFLFDGTIRDNIKYGNLDAGDDMIVEAAKNANIHDYIISLPNGYDTQVGERGIKLSGGQKQRISIARVFLKNPSVLILDEATSALDNATEMLIQNALEKLSEGRTCLIVAHRLSTIKNADEILVITKEGVIERGTHEQLLKNQKLYSKLYKYQFE